MRRVYNIALLIISILFIEKAKGDTLDSLLRVLQKSKDTVSLNNCLSELNTFVPSKAGVVLNILNNVGAQKALNSNLNSECYSKRIKARCYDFMDQPDDAINFYFQALEISKKIKNEEHSPFIYNSLGSLYIYRADYAKAQFYLLKSIRWFEDKNRIANSLLPLVNLANANYGQKNYKEAEKTWSKAIRLIDSLKVYENYKPMILGNMGAYYIEFNNHEKALECHKKALALIDINTDPFGYSNTLHNIGVAYLSQKKIKLAIAFLTEGLNISKAIGDSAGICTRTQTLSQAYYHDNKIDSAEYFGKISLGLALRLKRLQAISSGYRNLSGIYEFKKDYKTAFENIYKLLMINDSIYSSDKQNIFEEMQTKYETEKKDKELIKKDAQLALDKEESKRKSLFLTAALIIVILVLGSAYFIYNRYKLIQKQKVIIEEQKEKVEIAYEMLHEKNQEVMDSIRYAARIQRSLITSEKYVRTQLKRLMKK